MKETLEYILKAIIDNKDVTVTEGEDEGSIILTIHAPQDEIGRIIGKGGKVINAMKQLVKIQAIRENKRVEINVEDNESTETPQE